MSNKYYKPQRSLQKNGKKDKIIHSSGARPSCLFHRDVLAAESLASLCCATT